MESCRRRPLTPAAGSAPEAAAALGHPPRRARAPPRSRPSPEKPRGGEETPPAPLWLCRPQKGGERGVPAGGAAPAPRARRQGRRTPRRRRGRGGVGEGRAKEGEEAGTYARARRGKRAGEGRGLFIARLLIWEAG